MTTDNALAPASGKNRLILFPQDKGGIGKSFVATLIYDYLVEHGARVKAFDLDSANSTFQRYVPEAEFIDTDVDTDKLPVLDRLIEAFEEADVVLADNRAAGGTKVLAYLAESGLVELQAEIGFGLIFVLVAVDDKDAASQIADLLDSYAGRDVRWLVARNLRDGDQLTVFGESNSRKKLQQLDAVEIDIPCLAEVTRNRLQRSNLTVARGRSSEKLPILDRSRCVRFHERMAEQFGKADRLFFS